MHFLNQSVAALAQIRPDWQFITIASIALEKELQPIDHNVNVIYWDDDIWSRSNLWLAKKILRFLGKSGDAGFLLQSRFERFGLPWGKPIKIQRELGNLDLLWVPYYNISLKRLSLRKFLESNPTPIILTLHDIHPYFFSDEYPDYQITILKDEMIPFALTCSAIVTHSNFHKAAISNHFLISPKRIVVTPQPPLVNPKELLKPIPKQEQQSILKNLKVDGSYAFYPASTLHQHKNHRRLLEAWRELSIRFGDNTPKLVFTSKGNRKQWSCISNQIMDLGLEEFVIFTGFVDTKTLSVLYQNCSFVLIPTLYEGAGSGVLTDALTIGKPVICSKIPQILEQIHNYKNIEILLIEPESVQDIIEKVEFACHDLIELTQRASKNTEILSRSYSLTWQKWADVHINLFSEYINKKISN